MKKEIYIQIKEFLRGVIHGTEFEGHVMTVGGSEVTGERRKQFEDAFRRGAKRITLCFDLDSKKDAPDEPNFAARHEHLMKTIHTIKDIDPSFEEIYIASFDRPCDPDEYIHSEGAEAFCKLIAEAEPWWKYAYGYYEGKG